MVRLLWWNSLVQNPKTTAHYVDVDPIVCQSDKTDFLLQHPQGNGHNIDNAVGWWEVISLTISEDELSRPLFSGAATVSAGPTTSGGGTSAASGLTNQPFVRNAVEAWENARFRWIQADNVNGGVILRVTLQAAPGRTHPLQADIYNEYSYKLNGEAFHQNTV